MHKGLLIWNIALSVLLIGGSLAGLFLFQNYNRLTEEKFARLQQYLYQLNTTVAAQSEVINEHAAIINEHVESMKEEYAAAINKNQKLINDMNILIEQYQQMLNENAAYFQEILDNLKSLSIAVTE